MYMTANVLSRLESLFMNQIVLCTIELGLIREEMEYRGEGSDGHWELRPMVLPNHALFS